MHFNMELIKSSVKNLEWYLACLVCPFPDWKHASAATGFLDWL